jgi:hypothetical protein
VAASSKSLPAGQPVPIAAPPQQAFAHRTAGTDRRQLPARHRRDSLPKIQIKTFINNTSQTLNQGSRNRSGGQIYST